MNKIIILDAGVLTHRSIFAWGGQFKAKKELEKVDPIRAKKMFITPVSYNYFNTCLSLLKKIGIDKDDIIIVAKDGRNSWRKAFYPIYKGQRKALRQQHDHIDWNKNYTMISNLEKKLHEATDWHFILLNNTFTFADLATTEEGEQFNILENKFPYDEQFSIEADDIQAVCCKVFPKKEIILMTIDKDLNQLYYYDNVKIFNPNIKYKSKKGYYEIVKDPLKVLESKVRSGDVSDNILVDKKNDTDKEVEIRRLIIDLLNLPSFIEDPIISILNNLSKKEVKYDLLPCPNSLGKKERFDKIYEDNNIVSWEKSLKAFEERIEKKKESQRKSYAKRKVKNSFR